MTADTGASGQPLHVSSPWQSRATPPRAHSSAPRPHRSRPPISSVIQGIFELAEQKINGRWHVPSATGGRLVFRDGVVVFTIRSNVDGLSQTGVGYGEYLLDEPGLTFQYRYLRNHATVVRPNVVPAVTANEQPGDMMRFTISRQGTKVVAAGQNRFEFDDPALVDAPFMTFVHGTDPVRRWRRVAQRKIAGEAPSGRP